MILIAIAHTCTLTYVNDIIINSCISLSRRGSYTPCVFLTFGPMITTLLLLTLSCFVSWTHQAPLGTVYGTIGDESRIMRAAGPRSAFTCDACKGIMTVVQALLDNGAVREDIEKFAVYFCESLHIEDRNVCSTIVPLFSVRRLIRTVSRAVCHYVCSCVWPWVRPS